MSDNSKIEWTDATWNPITGCSMVSAGCTNCYAMQLAGTRLKRHPSRAGLTKKTPAGSHVWTGEVRFNEYWLRQPLKWNRPRRIFVCAHSDLFHESVPDEWIDRIFAVMALAKQHVFQVLTKRPERMLEYMNRIGKSAAILDEAARTIGHTFEHGGKYFVSWPLPNVWIGVSVEDQAAAVLRVPLLLQTPAAVRWVSAEPLLGRIDFKVPFDGAYVDALRGAKPGIPQIDWVVAGGESGNKARPMHPDWVRGLRDQCEVAGVPFLFKQWGEWGQGAEFPGDYEREVKWDRGRWIGGSEMKRVGKNKSGRMLDGVTHDGYPRGNCE